MNLGEIEAQVYDRMGYKSNPDSAVVNMVRRYINVVHRRILSTKGLQRLRRAVLPFTANAGSPLCVLPQAAVSVLGIVDRTNNRPLFEISLTEAQFRDPGLLFTSSIPDSYAILNFNAPVVKDPSAASALYVVSDNNTDGSGISAIVEGTTTGGYYRRARTSLAANQVPTQVGSSIGDWEHVTKFYLSTKALGTVTLTQGNGGTVLATLRPGRTYSRYTQIWLSGIPATAQTYYANVELHVEDMQDAYDEPLLPEDFHWLLEVGAELEHFVRRDKGTQWQLSNATYREGMRDLKWYVQRTTGPEVGRGIISQAPLGPYFPPPPSV